MTPPTSVSREFALLRDSFKTPPGPPPKTPPGLPLLWRPLVIGQLGCLEDSSPSTESSSQPSTVRLFSPLPGPQTQAFESDAFIIGYGGAAGGGKSLLELGLAVTKHRKSIVFRRHKEDVKDLWSKLRMLCGTHGRSNESSKEWRDLPGDRYVRLVGLQHEWDWMKYQGNENDLWCFDEATQFSELSIRTLIAWCRSPDPEQPCRVVLGFNPPTTAEGEWIIDFFAPWLDERHPNPAEPGELRWFARVDDEDVEREDGTPFEHEGELITPLSRTFFPARLEDNPILDATNYRSVLQGMPEPLRSQMLYGDFSIGLTDDEWQVIPTSWVRAAQARWTPEPPADVPLTQTGYDVAQGGADNVAIARRYDWWFAPIEIIPGKGVPDAKANCEHVTRTMADGGIGYIDGDGIGSSTYFLARATLGSNIRSYLGSAPTDWRDRARVLSFANTRSAAWWALREALDPSNPKPLALPPDRNLRVELCAARYSSENRTVKLEPKKDIKARLGRSPDLADAVVMAWWQGKSLTGVLAKTFKRKASSPDKQLVAPHVSNASERARELAEISDPRIRRRMALLDNGRGWAG